MRNDEQLAARVLENFDPVALADPILLESLAAYVNRLILEDFDQLIFILYQLDVSEKKLKMILAENTGTDAGKLIAGLIIERQLKRIESRRQHKKDLDEAGGEETW